VTYNCYIWGPRIRQLKKRNELDCGDACCNWTAAISVWCIVQWVVVKNSWMTANNGRERRCIGRRCYASTALALLLAQRSADGRYVLRFVVSPGVLGNCEERPHGV
jgi:hypothetical protein